MPRWRLTEVRPLVWRFPGEWATFPLLTPLIPYEVTLADSFLRFSDVEYGAQRGGPRWDFRTSMRIADALFLDAYPGNVLSQVSATSDVWISLRNDGVGVPFDDGRTVGAPSSISQIKRSTVLSGPTVLTPQATVTAASTISLPGGVNGTPVVIDGTGNDLYNGTGLAFTVLSTSFNYRLVNDDAALPTLTTGTFAIVTLGSFRGIGSGTQADPYDGSTRLLAPKTVALVKDATDGRIAIATATNHGLIAGDVALIAGANDASFNGRFVVYKVSGANTFYYYMDTAPAVLAGSNATFARVCFQFDNIMRALPANIRIHLGPGTFETRGYADGVPMSWSPKQGHKIVGAGMEVTTLRIVFGQFSYANYFPIGGRYNLVAHSFEAMDFTADAGVDTQPITALTLIRKLTCGGIGVVASRNTRIRRVRVINFGRLDAASPECFALALGGAPSDGGPMVNCVIEDCVLESPSANQKKESTCILLSGLPTTPALGCSVRNCYLDCTFLNWDTTPAGHYQGLTADGWIAGTVEGNRVVNTLFGEYHDTGSSSDLIIRNNYFQGAHYGVYQNLGASDSIACDPLHPPTRNSTTLIATITAPNGHGLIVGQGVHVSTDPFTNYVGDFDIISVPPFPVGANGSPTTFTVQLQFDPGPTSPLKPSYGALYQVDRLIVESNQAELIASTISDPSAGVECVGRSVSGSPWSLHQIFMRENLFRFVVGTTETNALGILIGAVETQRVENNVVSLGNPNPMGFNISGVASFLNNQTPSGTLLRGYKRLPSPSNGTKIDELATSIADALAFSLF